MAISTAIQKGSLVYVYDEKNHQLWTSSGELHGYTGSSVSIKRAALFMFMMKSNTRLVPILVNHLGELMF